MAAVQGFALVRLTKAGRDAIARLKNMASAKKWPGGRVIDAYPIKHLWGVTQFNAYALVEAASEKQLVEIFAYIEENFSHVDGYEM